MKTIKKQEEASKNVEVVVGEKKGLASVMVRMDANEPKYEPMYNTDGWLVGAGVPRVPELNKDIRLNLSMACKRGCTILAINGGLRLMKNANARGGVLFVEKKSAMSGKEIFLFSPATEESCKKAGLVVTRELKGVYVSPRNTKGELAIETILEKFTNNHRPMNFTVHPWPGYKVEEEKASEKKAIVKKEVKVEEKKEAKTDVKVEAKKPEVSGDGEKKRKKIEVVAKKEEKKVEASVPTKPVVVAKQPEKKHDKKEMRAVA